MTQVDVDKAKSLFDHGDFRFINYLSNKRTIVCGINETVTLVVKKTNSGITVRVNNSSKYVTLTDEIFNFICNCHVSISYMISFLESH